MHIIIGGSGRLGAELADRLVGDPEADVVVVDVDEAAFDRLGPAFNGETLLGDITDRDILEQAGVAHGDVLVAATRSDNANLMAVEIATVLYGVPTAVARLFDPEREDVYRRLGVRYVSGTGILAKLIVNRVYHDEPPRHLQFEDDEVAILDLTIGDEGHGVTVTDLELQGRLRVAAIERGSRVLIPLGDERLQPGDVVAAAVRRGAVDAVHPLLDLAQPRTATGSGRSADHAPDEQTGA